MNRKNLFVWAIASCLATDLYANNTTEAVVSDQQKVLKIGYVDSNYILEHLPEAKKCDAELKSFQKQLEQELQVKYKEFQDSVELAQQQMDSLTEEQKQQKRMELSKLQAALEELNNQMGPKIEQKYKILVTPLMARIEQVIKDLAQEQHYTFIFNKNLGAGNVIFFADDAFDISSQVLKKLTLTDGKNVEVPVVGPKTKALTRTKSEKVAKKVKSSTSKTQS